MIQWNESGNYDLNKNYSVDANDSIFVQNADLQSHGFNSTELGMGPLRNASILNTILEKVFVIGTVPGVESLKQSTYMQICQIIFDYYHPEFILVVRSFHFN